MSEFLGSRISLISKSDIRYVGTLHEINSEESTVSLENVRSFGTEGRKGRPEEEISPSDQVYEYIVFRGSDVKDLRIEEHPSIKENKPPVVPDDPAIVGARARPGAQLPPQNAPPGAGAFGQGPQGPYPPNNFYGGPAPPGKWGRGGAPGSGPIPNPNFGNMHYPPPPGWFPPGQSFPGGPGGHPGGPGGPVGPAPWGAYPYPPGPGGPALPGAPQSQRGVPTASPGPQPQPAPIAPGADRPVRKAELPGQAAPPTEPKSLAQGHRQPAHAPTPPVESKPSVEEVKAAASNITSNGPGLEASKPAPTGPRNQRITPVIPLTGSVTKPFSLPGAQDTAAKPPITTTPTNVQDATNAARAAVAVAMAQLGNPSGNAMDNLTKKVNEMRVNAVRGGPTTGGRGRGRGGRAAPGKVEVPDSDFDFAQANAKFNKQDVVKEAIAGSPLADETPTEETPEAPAPTDPAAYNKTRSFFDNISSEAKDRADSNGQKPGGREWRGEEQRKNMETFGQGSVDGGYRNYRGRGRGRGRGGRGGRGGAPRPQYQSTPPAQ